MTTNRRNRTVREVASVVLTTPVSGEPRRRGKDKRPRSSQVFTITVLPEVMAVVRKVKRPGERVVIVSQTCVELRPMSD